MKFALVEAEKTDCSLAKPCDWLGVSRAGYCAWRVRSPSAHAQKDMQRSVLVHEAHERSRRTYGSNCESTGTEIHGSSPQ